MQTRNTILFFALSMASLIAYNVFILPRIAPQAKKPVVQNVAKKDGEQASVKKADALAANPDKSVAPQSPSDKSKPPDKSKPVAATAGDKSNDKSGGTKKAEATPAVAAAAKTPTFEHKSVVLGSSDPDTGYFLQVELTTVGASVASLELNDPRYRELSDTKVPLKLVGNGLKERMLKALEDRHSAQSKQEVAAEALRAAEGAPRSAEATADIETARTALQAANERLKQAERDVALAQTTFNTDVPEIDALLPKGSDGVATRDWKVAEVTADKNHAGVNSAVTFEYPSPDGQLVLEKRYKLEPVEEGAGTSRDASEVRDTTTTGYLLHLDITMRNKGAAERTVNYTLQGPVGVPLEDAANARKLRDLKMGFLLPDGKINSQTKTASQVLSDEEKNKVEEWKSPIQYIGVDVQYFAALVLPPDQLNKRTIERSMPMLLEGAEQKANTDLSVQLDSVKVVLPGQNAVTHQFELFAGPKRRALLTSLQAEGVLDFGWIARVSNAMLWLLNAFHSIGIPYGIAIICLTVLVRACMFPVSLRQTAQAQRMKEMQPKLAEIKKKYADNKEKLAMANLELMREHGVNPMAGCLPVLLQMPIFIGLYQALQYSVDLRLAPFLYFNNLAAPDALFKLPFTIPYLGWTTFNLLPIIAVGLMVVQQKMFMPPPTDEQQEMQQKMMNVMMVVMGAMFYKVPAGLCVYFISSSFWGLGERKLLGWWKPSKKATPADPTETTDEEPQVAARGKARPAAAPGRVRGAAGSFWKSLLDAADAANTKASTGSKSATSRRREPDKRNGKRSRP
jgi:YidC/Oxa1 family membrane protein insertase